MSIRRICSRLIGASPSTSAVASSSHMLMLRSPAARHFACLLAAASKSSGAFSSSTMRLCSHQSASHATENAPQADAAAAAAASSAAKEAAHRVIIVKDHQGKVVPNPPSIGKFEDIPNAPQWLRDGLQRLGYPTTTDIQSITMPQLLEGHDVIGLAPTGSGKTVAFAVPALTMFERSPQNIPTILVLAPTRELVQQTCKVFQDLGGRNVRVCEAYGGAPRETQSMRINRGCDVLVACPGRLKDFLESGLVSLEHLRFLVFDEADRMLDMGFKIQLDEILQYVDRQAPRQTMMWSATWPTAVQRIASEYLAPNRLMIRAGAEGTGAQVNHRIKQHIHFAEGIDGKVEQLALLIENGTIKEDGCKMMIFVERQLDTESVANLLSRRLGIRGSNLGVLHGGMQQRRRDYVMQSFKDNECRILVATDVASRGLDFPDVTVVVNFAAPKDIDSYCHRIGRTGRAGRQGDAHSFLDGNDGSLAKDLIPYLKLCNMPVPEPLHELSRRQSYRNNFRRGPRRGGGGGGGYGGGGGRGGYQRNSGYDQEESWESGSSSYGGGRGGDGSRNYSRNGGGGGGNQQHRGGGGRSWQSDGFDM